MSLIYVVLFQCLFRIERFPPRVVSLEIFSEPSKYCGLPLLALVELSDLMVGIFDCNKRGFAPEKFESGVNLNTFTDGYVGVAVTVEEENRSMNLIGVVERTVPDEEVAMTPRIAVSHADFAVRISPIAFAPIACVVADTGMRDCCGKDVGLCLEILGHETAV